MLGGVSCASQVMFDQPRTKHAKLSSVQQPDRPAESEHDPVPGEGYQPMASDEADQAAHDWNGNQKGSDESDRYQVDATRGEPGSVLPQIEHRRSQHGRNGQIE